MKILFYIIIALNFSCANYIQSMHKQFDGHKNNQRKYSLADKYGSRKLGKVSTGNKKFLSPGVKRNYEPKENTKRRRYAASDFKDSRQDGSIWLSSSGRDRDFLFSKNVNIRVGDIVLIQVQKKLRNDIAGELERAFTRPQRTNGLLGEKNIVENVKKKTPKEIKTDDNKIFDIISSIVMDEVNSNHLVVKGEKEILFRNKKQLVEVQALVNRQHVEPDGSLASSKIIENQIQVVRLLK